MSLFPRALVSPDPQASFSPLFRLLDDFDNYKSSASGNNHNHHQQPRGHLARSFNPRFDVKELADQYELHGELPGIERKDVDIEFVDPQTLTVRGRTERSSFHSPSSARIEDAARKDQITEKGEKNHSATVEDEDSAKAHESTAVATTTSQQQQQQEQEVKYWVSERSVGEFHRSFTFPARVDLDGVTASMKNGILSIIVPKAKRAGVGRKITVS